MDERSDLSSSLLPNGEKVPAGRMRGPLFVAPDKKHAI